MSFLQREHRVSTAAMAARRWRRARERRLRCVPDAEGARLRRVRREHERARREFDAAETERVRLVERGRLAATVDRELREACRAEAAARLAMGGIACELLRRRAYRRLGFARLGDYARERLGVSARALESAARVATRLEELPAIDTAFRRGELTWTLVRLLSAVARPADEVRWIASARCGTVDDLEALVASAPPATGAAVTRDPDPEDDLIDGEPAAHLRIECPGRVRVLWRRALELARRVAGAPLAPWQAAEIIAAEGIAGRPPGTEVGDRTILACMRLARRGRRAAATERRRLAEAAYPGAPAAPGTTIRDSGAAHGASDTAVVATGVLAVRARGTNGMTDTSTNNTTGTSDTAGTTGITVASGAVTSCVATTAPELSTAVSPPFASDVQGSRGAEREPGSAPPASSSSGSERPADAALPLASCDAFTLDARLRAAVAAVGGVEPRIGRLLRLLVDHRLYRNLGSASLERYVRDHLGISLRKVWALLKIERAVCRAPVLADAYASGRLSWVRALTLLPVVDRQTAGEWLARADAVTLRRLTDEVNWVLDRRDILGSGTLLEPPPLDAVLVAPAVTMRGTPVGDGGRRENASGVGDDGRYLDTSPVGGDERCRDASPVGHDGQCQDTSPMVRGDRCREMSPETIVQIGAPFSRQPGVTEHGTGGGPAAEVRDAEIRFTGPASVVALFRDALDVYARPGELRWVAVERLLARVTADWEAEPRHRDPVFARDGWRCSVPGCSGRRNLHDHHLRFRSHGGGNERDNRLTVCAAHHLHGIHAGVIRAWGRAPAAVHWELGVRTGAAPFLEYVGDRLVHPGRS
jgi:hypothetical protein